MTTKLEPKGKLGIASAAVGAVNGPEDELFDWDAVDWRACERRVERLRQRIFTASQVGDPQRVRNLQKLMLRSRANTLLAVRRVTEVNAGRLTAGVDGRIVLDGQDKAALVNGVQRRQKSWRARPVKRVYIPKADGRSAPVRRLLRIHRRRRDRRTRHLLLRAAGLTRRRRPEERAKTAGFGVATGCRRLQTMDRYL